MKKFAARIFLHQWFNHSHKKPPKIFHYQNNGEICQRDFFRWSGTLSDKTLKLENDCSNFSALKPSLQGELQNFEAKHEQLFPISLWMKIFPGYGETVVQKNRGNIYFHRWFTWLTLALPWINWINKLWTIGTNQTPELRTLLSDILLTLQRHMHAEGELKVREPKSTSLCGQARFRTQSHWCDHHVIHLTYPQTFFPMLEILIRRCLAAVQVLLYQSQRLQARPLFS